MIIKSKLWIILVVSALLGNTAWAKFCSECGKSLPSDTAKFCSECGASVNQNTSSNTIKNNDSIQDRVEELFAPVDEFAVFLSSSNFITCIAKYPEYKIKFNKNKKDIDKLEASCDEITKKVIKNYYLYWDVLCNSLENYNSTNSYNTMGEEYRCKFLFSYINEVKSLWKSGASLSDITKVEKVFIVATKVFTMCKSEFFRVKGGAEVMLKNARFMLVDVDNDKIKIVVIGGKNNSGVGYHSTMGGSTEASLNKLWFPVVNRKDILKRTDCTEDDLNTFKSIIQK